MEHLISSKDFGKLLKYKSDAEYRRLRENFDAFLDKQLKLGYFVPCDENDVPLEEPSKEMFKVDVNTKCSGWRYLLNENDEFIGYYDDVKYQKKLKEYQEAKQRVLFVFKPQFEISVIKHHILQNRNIEYLANFGALELTETAKKEI